MKKVLLIEDDIILTDTITDYFASELYQINHKSDGLEGFKDALKQEYDLILLDINLPKRSGFIVARDLREVGIETPIIAITARCDSETRMTCRQMGIDNILMKPFSMRELTIHVKATLQRPPKSSKEDVMYKDLVYDPIMQCIKRNEMMIDLRKLEVDLFKYMLKNKGIILTRDMLYKNMYEWDSDTLESTIDVHLCNLRRKLRKGNDKETYIRTVYKRGYIMQ